MKVKNRRTRETLEIEYSEFRKRIASRVRRILRKEGSSLWENPQTRLTRATKQKFAKEIQVAFDSFRQTELNKTFYNYKDDNSMEFNFYFQFQWNFNHFGNSVWYIERM